MDPSTCEKSCTVCPRRINGTLLDAELLSLLLVLEKFRYESVCSVLLYHPGVRVLVLLLRFRIEVPLLWNTFLHAPYKLGALIGTGVDPGHWMIIFYHIPL